MRGGLGCGKFYINEINAIERKWSEKADEPYDKLNPFDIRNAKGIFSKAEYAVMNAQAKRLLGKSFSEDITNNQFI